MEDRESIKERVLAYLYYQQLCFFVIRKFQKVIFSFSSFFQILWLSFFVLFYIKYLLLFPFQVCKLAFGNVFIFPYCKMKIVSNCVR